MNCIVGHRKNENMVKYFGNNTGLTALTKGERDVQHCLGYNLYILEAQLIHCPIVFMGYTTRG